MGSPRRWPDCPSAPERKYRATARAGLRLKVTGLPFLATCATRRALDPSDATAVGLKALLSIHRVYALPLVAGRTRSPALIARQVYSPRSAQTCCSPVAQPAPVAGGGIIPTALLSRVSRAALTSDLARRAPCSASKAGNSAIRPALRGQEGKLSRAPAIRRCLCKLRPPSTSSRPRGSTSKGVPPAVAPRSLRPRDARFAGDRFRPKGRPPAPTPASASASIHRCASVVPSGGEI